MSDPRQEIRALMATIRQAQQGAALLLRGRKVRIVSDYNGQPYGHSRPSMRGRLGEIVLVHMTGEDCEVWLKDLQYGYPALSLSELEFIMVEEDENG